jgi:hypothetical protein
MASPFEKGGEGDLFFAQSKIKIKSKSPVAPFSKGGKASKASKAGAKPASDTVVECAQRTGSLRSVRVRRLDMPYALDHRASTGEPDA